MISALDGIKDNIYNVIRNLEHFKLEREYLRIPEEDRKLLEKYQEQMSAYGLHQYEERQELIRQVYASQTSPYVIEYADDIVDFNSWHLLNLRNDPIKYDGNYIRTIVAETISDIEDKIATELKKKRRKKKKDNFDEDEDDENNDYDKYNEMLNLRTDALTITCKIYYQLNSLGIKNK